ncbi:hypothetical protein SAMN04489724_4677 [Algoriphagus locisalis]|uniref:Uncharacterized protein n=1 Tax=Algoriphagus locisalis TaxID=305507 RepID=A0A1I7E0Y7_9BACT|nr:hypothetical protein [Algoriphagus locisalis]SFU17602.1 hypothetical protein SAMN04489724_4677 [Algoriphagus locisalis]
MKTLLRTYLILIFASSALNAGSENDSVKMRTGFVAEASNFAMNSSYPQNLEEIADCMNSARKNEFNSEIGTIEEKNSSLITVE